MKFIALLFPALLGAQPVASFTATCYRAPSTTCTVNGGKGGASYTWVWGDGTHDVSKGADSAHVYAKAGTFSVRMVIVASSGQFAYTTHSVIAGDPKGPAFVPSAAHVAGVFVDSVLADSNGKVITPRTVWFVLKGATLWDSAGQLVLCQRLWGPSSVGTVQLMPCEVRLYPSVDSVLRAMAIP